MCLVVAWTLDFNDPVSRVAANSNSDWRANQVSIVELDAWPFVTVVIKDVILGKLGFQVFGQLALDLILHLHLDDVNPEWRDFLWPGNPIFSRVLFDDG